LNRWGRRGRGFTLIEMMVVIFIILVLASIAAGKYYQTVIRARESVLRQDLHTLRTCIENYTRDKENPPSSLDDLVTGGYLTQIPKDPITGYPDWNTQTCDTVLSPEQNTVGMCDVHSNSDKISPFDNTPYSSW
jgi:general secretion pathway protein G